MTMSEEKNSGSRGKEEESEDESEILEESPCGRWQKRKEQVLYFSDNCSIRVGDMRNVQLVFISPMNAELFRCAIRVTFRWLQ